MLKRFGRYEITGVVGEGGFATVYRAFDPALKRAVALKALHTDLAALPDVRSRFQQEAMALAKVRHPHIVGVYDIGEADGRPFFAMEFVDGQTLSQLVGGRPQSLTWVVGVLQQLAGAIDALHAAGVVHRDIKPSNVMVGPGGDVVLMDLGVARFDGGADATHTGQIFGTPSTMAPEQALSRPAGTPADIYALGVLAYWLLAGAPPFEGESLAIMHAQAYETPPSLSITRPDLPSYAVRAIDQALAKEPDARPATATAFVAMLSGDVTGMMADEPTLMSPPPLGPAPQSRSGNQGQRKRIPYAIGASLLAGMAMVGTAIAFAWPRLPQSSTPSAAPPPSPTAAAVVSFSRATTTPLPAPTPPPPKPSPTSMPTSAPRTPTPTAPPRPSPAPTSPAPAREPSIAGGWLLTDIPRVGSNAGESFEFRINLSQRGNQVTGVGSGLQIRGELRDGTLRATFTQAGPGRGSGTFTWQFNDDGTAFSGSFTHSSGNQGDSIGRRVSRGSNDDDETRATEARRKAAHAAPRLTALPWRWE